MINGDEDVLNNDSEDDQRMIVDNEVWIIDVFAKWIKAIYKISNVESHKTQHLYHPHFFISEKKKYAKHQSKSAPYVPWCQPLKARFWLSKFWKNKLN